MLLLRKIVMYFFVLPFTAHWLTLRITRFNIQKYYAIPSELRLPYLCILCVSQNTNAIFVPLQHWSRHFSKITGQHSRPQFTLPPLGSLTSWRTRRHLVVESGNV